MELKELLVGLDIKSITGNIDNIKIDILCDNSNLATKNSLFVAISGLRVDAHNFALDAIKNGAIAVVVERVLEVDVPQILVKNTRKALCIIANNFYNNPTTSFKIISLIGTNGKTTTTYLIKDILEANNFKVGVIGTSGVFVGGKKIEANLTTPDTLELFSLFNKMRAKGVEVVVMEISAHAIKLNKIKGFKSDIAVFTNFSQDHLDFFKTLENYKNTKMSYFTNDFARLAVVNTDDEVGQTILKNTPLKTLTYGIKNPADIFCVDIKMNLAGSGFFINLNDNVYKINFNLPAKFNIYNALAASCACFGLGLTPEQIIKGLSVRHHTYGRFNIIKVGKNSNVIIDYAHTPEAINNLLLTVKKLSKAKMLCVFGCPGNREQQKRIVTGKIVGELCDYAIITTDNPNLENPNIIFEQIESGLKQTSCAYSIIEDRTQAILVALNSIKNEEKTNILIVGKGSENYQIINSLNSPYNDEEEIKKYLKSKRQKTSF